MTHRFVLLLTFALLATGLPSRPAFAQGQEQEVVLTLEEAVQIALIQNLALENARLDVKNGSAQINEGWAELFPQVDVNSSYTRNVRSANPFAGSQAGGLFQSLGFLDWLAYNERARTDADGSTAPISAEEFFLRQAQGLSQAGVQLDSGDNPFAVPSVYLTGLTINQKVFDGRVIYGAYGASKWLKPFNMEALKRQEQVLVRDVKNAWYAALLAEQQTQVSRQSVDRARRTMQEVTRQVDQGVAPKFQRLSAEVEVANLETALVQAEMAEAGARDNLRLLLGMSIEHQLRLRGSLEAAMRPDYMVDSSDDAGMRALSRRPDLKQAEIGIELEKIQLQVARAEYLPNLNAFANFNWLGNVPDNRRVWSSVDGDPFTFTTEDRGYFDTAYWDRSVSVGFRLTWNIFNGLATHQRIQQRKIALQRAENDVEFLTRSIRIEVDQSLRNLRAAHRRMQSQQKNLERAQLNFEHAEARLREGVATPLEVREASNQLDQTQLNYLQAVHDVLVAQSTYEAAVGQPAQPAESR